MKKPKKLLKRTEYYNYNSCVKYINKKYDIDIRDYAGKPGGKGNTKTIHFDFWHWILHHYIDSIQNPCELTLNIDKMIKLADEEDWVLEILALFEKEFFQNKREHIFLIEW